MILRDEKPVSEVGSGNPRAQRVPAAALCCGPAWCFVPSSGHRRNMWVACSALREMGAGAWLLEASGLSCVLPFLLTSVVWM